MLGCVGLSCPHVLDPKELGTTFGYTTHQILEFPTLGHPIPLQFPMAECCPRTPGGARRDFGLSIGAPFAFNLCCPGIILEAFTLGAFLAPPTLGMVSGPFRAPRALFWTHFGLPGITLGAFRAPGHCSWAISCPPGIILDEFRAPGHCSGSISCPRAFLALTQVQENQHCYTICPPIHR